MNFSGYCQLEASLPPEPDLIFWCPLPHHHPGSGKSPWAQLPCVMWFLPHPHLHPSLIPSPYLFPQQPPATSYSFICPCLAWPVPSFCTPSLGAFCAYPQDMDFISICMSALSDSDHPCFAFQITPPSGTSLSSGLSSWLACCSAPGMLPALRVYFVNCYWLLICHYYNFTGYHIEEKGVSTNFLPKTF